jgi:hypothetical protein
MSITIAGSNVTFVPVPGVLISGVIDSSGEITIPDWTTGFKAFDCKPQNMSSRLTMNLDGSIHGEWSIVEPGYCSPRLISTNFPPPLRLPFLDLTLIGVK